MPNHPDTYVVDGLAPRTVRRPDTPEAVAAVLRKANGAGEAVIPWGAGTKQGIGNRPRAYDVALDLTALDQVLEYEPADLVVTAQAGMPLAKLQRRLAEAGQFLALDPPYVGRGTVGGTLAANVSGPSRLLYGTARDLVLGLRVATPEGQLVKSGGKVVKNVVGYDLNKLHIGGLGTAGVMVEVTLKVHPLPKAQATLCATFEPLAPAHDFAMKLFRSALYPRAVELVRAPLAPVDRRATYQGWRVLMWAAGSETAVERQLRDATAWCREAGGAPGRLDGDIHDALWDEVREFGRAPAPDAVLLKLACLPSQVAALASAIDRAAREAGAPAAPAPAPPAMVAHAGSGVLYVALACAETPLVQAAMGAALRLGGSAVIEHAPTPIKEAFDVWGPTRGDFPLMQALKAQFDPKSTLNPGRFVGRL